MVLSDFGATVTKVDRMISNPLDCLAKGKRTIAINLKNTKGQELVRELCKTSDVLIEPYRPGVMENLNLGPDILLKENPRLIYARLTGFGQTGPLAKRAGHDINYVALSGVLSFLGKSKEPPSTPVNLIGKAKKIVFLSRLSQNYFNKMLVNFVLADFAGGGLLCAFGILAALIERHRSGLGQIVDCSMSEGAAYVGSFLTRSQNLPIWSGGRGENMLDGGAFFYSNYETSDGKYMSVGALEPQFYQEFIQTLGVGNLEQSEAFSSDARKIVEEKFKTKTQKEWTDIFEKLDACVFPVLDWHDADQHPHNRERKSFVDKQLTDDVVVANPAPQLSRTPATSSVLNETVEYDAHVSEILGEIGMNAADISNLYEDGALLGNKSKL